MEPIITTVVTLLGLIGLPAAIAGGATLYVVHLARDTITEKVKAAINAEYDERLAALKAQLKADNNLELERHKHALALEANRQNVRFARLHEIRASVIADVYAALSDTYEALKAYTAAFEPAGCPSKEERLKTLAGEHGRFRKAFASKKIYFPPDVAEQLQKINMQIFAAGNEFMWTVQNQQHAHGQTEAWMGVLNKVDGPIKDTLQTLEAEFRKLLGDDHG
jgi:hypothetical protein